MSENENTAIAYQDYFEEELAEENELLMQHIQEMQKLELEEERRMIRKLCWDAAQMRKDEVADIADMIQKEFFEADEDPSRSDIDLISHAASLMPESGAPLRNLAAGRPIDGLDGAVKRILPFLDDLEGDLPYEVNVIRTFSEFRVRGDLEPTVFAAFLSRLLLSHRASSKNTQCSGPPWEKSCLKVMRDEWTAWEMTERSEVGRAPYEVIKRFYKRPEHAVSLLRLCSEKEIPLDAKGLDYQRRRLMEDVGAMLPLAEGLYREMSFLEEGSICIYRINLVLKFGQLVEALRVGRSIIEEQNSAWSRDQPACRGDHHAEVFEIWRARFLSVHDAVVQALAISPGALRKRGLKVERLSPAEFKQFALSMAILPSNSIYSQWAGALSKTAKERLEAISDDGIASGASGINLCSMMRDLRIGLRCVLFACMHATMCMILLGRRLGFTPFQFACEFGGMDSARNLDYVRKCLHERKASVEEANAFGETPLMLAITRDRHEIVEELRKHVVSTAQNDGNRPVVGNEEVASNP